MTEMEIQPYGGPITLASDRDPWERQPDEDDTAWTAFKCYRDAPPLLRSLRTAYERFTAIHPNANPCLHGHVPDRFRIFSKVNRWTYRIEVFDRYMDELEIRTLALHRIQMIKETAQLGKEMRDKALLAIRNLHAIISYKVVDMETGKVTIGYKTTLSPSAIVAIAKCGIELEKWALGLDQGPLPVTQGPKGPGLPVQASDPMLMERAAEVIQAQKALQAPQPQQQTLASVKERGTVTYAEVAGSMLRPAPVLEAVGGAVVDPDT